MPRALRRSSIHAVVLGIALAAAQPAGAQARSPVADALRQMLTAVTPRIVLAAQAMPAGKYDERLVAREETFGETLAIIANYSSLYCQRLSGVPDKTPASDETHRRDSLVVHVQRKLDYCHTALSTFADAGLADSVRLDGLKTKAVVAQEFAMFLATRYEYMTALMRQQGVVPPYPCSGAGGVIDCGSGQNLCAPFRVASRDRLTAVLADAPYAVRSDGKGRYHQGTSNVRLVFAGRAGVLVLGNTTAPPTARRAVLVDLSHPVAGDIGVPLGVVRDSENLEVAGQWESDPATHQPRSLLDIPVGTTVPAQQIDVEFHVNGVVHDLQAGPQPVGHCYTDGTAVHGKGTSTGTITRADSSTWVIDLPEGSSARLFDVGRRYPYAVDKGLYRISLKLVVRADGSVPAGR